MKTRFLSLALSLLMVFTVFSQAKNLSARADTNTTDSTAQERLAEIYTSIFPTSDPKNHPSYFTVNESNCTHEDHGTEAGSCMNCELGHVLEKLAKENPDKFDPCYNLFKQNPFRTRTCLAFAEFVWLYAFNARNWVSSETIVIQKDAQANYTNFSKLVPGDFVTFYQDDDFYHAAIFLNCSSTGVTLLDCNWKDKINGVATYKCGIVRVRTVTYNSLSGLNFLFERARTSEGGSINAVDATKLTLPVGASTTLSFLSGSASSYTLKSSDTNVAEISSAGKITANGAGTTTVTVSNSNGSDSVEIFVPQVSFTCAENWTAKSELGPRVVQDPYDSTANYANRRGDGSQRYTIPKGSVIYVFAKSVDKSGNTWGFACGKCPALGADIWGWVDLLDDELGDEQFNYSYVPDAPVVTAKAAGSGKAIISWDPVKNARYYHVYRNGSACCSWVYDTSVTVELESSSDTFVVEAVNDDAPYSDSFPCRSRSAAVTVQESPVTDTFEERLEKLESIDGFTCTGKRHTAKVHDIEYGCRLRDIINTKWVKDFLGGYTVSINQLPASFAWYNDTAASLGYNQCYGFASFAQWYLLRESNASTVIMTSATDWISFNENNVAANCKPGDIIRLSWLNENGIRQNDAHLHSVIYLSHDSKGIKVLDCNYSLNCGVEIHEISYDHWNGCRMKVTHAQNLDSIVKPVSRTYTVQCQQLNCRVAPDVEYDQAVAGKMAAKGDKIVVTMITPAMYDGKIWAYGTDTTRSLTGWFCIDSPDTQYCSQVFTVTSAPKKSAKKGDVNRDGEVNVMDYITLKAIILGENVPCNATLPDLNGDGNTDVFDYLYLKALVLGIAGETN